MSALMIELDPHKDEAAFVNAGHPPAIPLNAQGVHKLAAFRGDLAYDDDLTILQVRKAGAASA